MKKIGILTFQRAHNLGAMLQAFALQQQILDSGYECELIDYRNIGTPEYYARLYKKKNPNIIKYFLYRLLRTSFYHKYHKKFRNFQKDNLKYSNYYFEDKNVLIKNKVDENYDTIIVGSDQVWNLDLTDNDFSYFLDFFNDNSKKVSYAASLGKITYEEDILKEIVSLINNFSMVSVRETEGAALLKTLTDKEIKTVLDPTLLYPKTYWLKKAAVPKIKEEFIFCYVIGTVPQKAMELCRYLSDVFGIKIIIGGNNSFRRKKEGNIKYLNSLSPFEFVGYIANAKVVITSSFHGTAFAINLNKDFYSIPVNFNDPKLSRNSRITSLLNLAGLQNRFFNNETSLPKIEEISIDYEDANKKMEFERKQSIDFLNNVLNFRKHE
ncbi:MAG: polysaccharide pyruvyl transferase family protein [Bacteroidales bacterium]|jgi:hypothetical protein|nr:polysaccharide pyruvyl transferase family protein [Bacteroidales bacterium]